MLYFLPLAGLLTSLISGVIGMGGGVLLLSLMSFFLPYQQLIPIHGMVQLISNSSRGFILRKYVRNDFLWPFVLGAPIGFYIAYTILSQIKNPAYLYLLLALFILYALFKPKTFPQMKLRSRGWFLLGIGSGIQGSLIGATGPLIAPFYLRDDLEKEEIVATKAAQQLVTHLLKIPLFLSLDFNYLDFATLLGFLALTTVIGTWLGVKLLSRIDTNIFKIIFKSVLFIGALRLFYKFWIHL